MNNIKTALVTGANKGIGLATVEGLAKEGYRVWLGSRDFSRGQAAVDDLRSKGLDVYLLMIDVADDSSVIEAARTLNEHTPHLNILINNAGVAPNLKSLPGEESMNLIRQTFETNTFGPIRVTQAFLPLLKAADQARVIMLSSIVGSIGLSSDPNVIYGQVNFMGYSASKAALNMITAAFAKELGPFGIKVYAVEPGHIRTELNDNTGTLSTQEGAVVPIKYATMDLGAANGGFFGPNGILPW
ncbi:SDR family NAD(P)-dependent oxidoreductase [Dyadobacter sp. LJ53]|uniref:SDR family NAD(P)-dependent oxidoreductase n=1 Tax=Dyadobacter chenwenxiniae TaxID=2906456 RepID=UPI001F2BF02C|nr:SDR family NAD(P)-dependent oxidoreductase [Dyadobacter chenwenxiniae]MCF0052691.1 SDR family NAD(P)-dependent oxidoreductase [Dyadobacter chenwenxiniae]